MLISRLICSIREDPMLISRLIFPYKRGPCVDFKIDFFNLERGWHVVFMVDIFL